MIPGSVANAASAAPSTAPAPWRSSAARRPGCASSTSIAAKHAATNTARSVIIAATVSAARSGAPEPNLPTSAAVVAITATPTQKPGRASLRSAAR